MKAFGISVTLHLRPSQTEGKEGTLYYQIIANREAHQVSSNYAIHPDEWDEKHRSILIDSQRHEDLSVIKRRTLWEMRQLHQMVRTMLEEDLVVDYQALANTFHDLVASQSFSSFTKAQIDKLKTMNKTRRSETYESALSSLMKFTNGKDLMFYELTSDLMEQYQEHLKSTGITMNTISFYMRQLRAIYNRAVKQRITPQTYPFSDVYTGRAETKKRAITKADITHIKNLDLEHLLSIAFARDMFMLSFYLRGISFVDMVFLKKSDLKDGYLTYHRLKTGQHLTIKWEPPMQEIVDRYPTEGEYLLPFIKSCDISEHRQYKNASKALNRNLKKVASLADIPTKLTMYVSRHSWASIAKQMNVPISVISEGLGHDSERTTQIYLATLDTTPVDDANSAIISLL